MKKATIFLVLLVIAAASFGQQINPPSTVNKIDYLKKSKNQKTTAWILLGGGSALVVTGILLSNNASFDNLGTTAGVAIVGGLAMFGSIPLFIASGRNKRKSMSLSFKNEAAPQIQKSSFVNRSIPSLSLKIGL